MRTIPISSTERVIITRSEMQNTVQFQIKETNGWETKYRKAYDGNWKGNIVLDIKSSYEDEIRRNKQYKKSKLQPYH
ncbi:hypothetical protein [Dyadobacter sp. 3J3]|uniref:hypothetical protein n=1 Tax=Dyadobacter sp. 3J3 TaxID=2606600 RepID=UPI00135717C0|nr:hypothetical protein [Dyadobacter sp. 3J3]